MSASTQLFDAETTRKVEAVYLTPDVVAQRSATLRVLQLAEGEQVLDIGSGPGLLAHQMAAAVGPKGSVNGIDTSEPMLDMSRKRCAAQPWVEFRQADAIRLPYPDGSFGAAVPSGRSSAMRLAAAGIELFPRSLNEHFRFAGATPTQDLRIFLREESSAQKELLDFCTEGAGRSTARSNSPNL
jgi:SAM-dependent methyltransferase